MATNARTVYSTESHNVDVWTVPCPLLGGAWNRVWFAVRTPNMSAAYAAYTIRGTATADCVADHIATLCRLGHLPADAVQAVGTADAIEAAEAAARARDRYNALCYG